jgi:hypothetical protein
VDHLDRAAGQTEGHRPQEPVRAQFTSLSELGDEKPLSAISAVTAFSATSWEAPPSTPALAGGPFGEDHSHSRAPFFHS